MFVKGIFIARYVWFLAEYIEKSKVTEIFLGL
jgi:hypothetical protein